MPMTKTMAVLEIREEGATPDGTSFGRSNDDIRDGMNPMMVVLWAEDWVDLGEPKQITVTVEPGDKLND